MTVPKALRALMALGVLIAFFFCNEKKAALAQGSRAILKVPEVRLTLVERATLAAERTGILEQVAVREGDEVAEGDLVARLRDQVIRAQLAIAEKQLQNDVDLRFARKSAELANIEFSKLVQVNQGTSGTISEMELRRQRLASEKALLQMEQAQFQLEIARLQRDETQVSLSAYRVLAPWGGVITKVSKRRGEAVREGEPIAEIADLSRLRAEGHVSLADSLRLQVGSVVQMQVDLPEGTGVGEIPSFAGQIVFIEPKVDLVSRKVRIWAEIVNSKGFLKEGMQGTLSIATP